MRFQSLIGMMAKVAVQLRGSDGDTIANFFFDHAFVDGFAEFDELFELLRRLFNIINTLAHDLIIAKIVRMFMLELGPLTHKTNGGGAV